MGDEMTPKPGDLTDSDWKHGSSDGEIFTVIRDGVKTTAMKPYGKKLTTHQLWDVVNYVRSIGPKTGTH
jgi:mono/diheme cytochrome c family protein